MAAIDSEHEPESVKLRHLASQKQNTSFFDKRKVIPILGYQLGYPHKTSLYDDVVTLAVGDDQPHDVCYDHDRNRIWIVCYTSPTIVLRMNPEDFTYDRLTLAAGTNLGYRIAYDGKWIWVVDSEAVTPAHVTRINPDTLAYDTLTLPANYIAATGLCVGGLRGGTRYVWVGVQTGAAPWVCSVLRFDPDDWPNYDEADIIGVIGGFSGIRELVFDGQRIWAGGENSNVCWLDVETMAITNAGPIAGFGGNGIFSGGWDGSYLWWGDSAGRLAKFNPDTYVNDVMQLQFTTGLVHAIRSDGKYVHVLDYTDGYYYILHPETMEYSIHETVDAGRHGICFDGTYIWIVNAVDVPGTVERYMVHEPSRHVEHGQTGTFAIDAVAQLSTAVTFDIPFTRTPIVTVGLNDISDVNAQIENVEAESITVNGFNARCRVAGHQIFVPYNGKIADITHADTNLHTLDLAAALTETRKIIAVIVMDQKITGTGVLNVYPNEGAQSSYLSGDTMLMGFVVIADGTQRLQYALSVANDDFDLYCLGYVVEVGVGATNSTARFTWIATERSTYHP